MTTPPAAPTAAAALADQLSGPVGKHFGAGNSKPPLTAAAHQTHGAVGMTKDYPLRYLTRRLWAGRDEAGGHRRRANRLGRALVAYGPDALYPAIQCGSEVVEWTD